MSAEIIQFPVRKNDAVVQMLEHQLALAKEGKLTFVAFAAVSDRGTAYSGWAPDNEMGRSQITSAMGAVSFLSARFNESVLMGTEESPPDEAA